MNRFNIFTDRIYCLIITLVFIHTPCEGGSPRTVTITLPGNVVTPPIVSVKEGDSITLSCQTDIEDTTILWTKVGDANFYHNSEDLTLQKVQLNHGGVYTCAVKDQHGHNITSLTGNSQVELNILYSPSRVTITGPMSSLKNENFSLSCSSQGNPDPVYRWTYMYNDKDTSTTPLTIHRGPVFTETNFGTNTEFFCFAESTLIPTQGSSLTASAVGYKHILKHESATIWELKDDYYVEEGDTLDVMCKTGGYPHPIAWWTKAGNYSVINNGHRLVVPNIKIAFDGFYTCYAENTIIDSQGSKRLITDTRNTYIHVTKKDSTNGTQTACSPTPKCNNTLSETDFSEETCASRCNIISGEKKQSDQGCSNGIISALVIGWIVVTILIVIGLFYHIRVRHAKTSDVWIKHHNSKDQTVSGFSSKRESRNTSPHDRPELPRPPEESVAVHRGTPDGSNSRPTLKLKLSDEDGYIIPKSNLRVTKSLDPDETPRYAASHLDPNCLLSASGAYEEPFEPYISLPSSPVSTEGGDVSHGDEYEVV